MSDDAKVTTKRHHVTREEEADRDLNGTTFSKGSAALVALIFLGTIFGVNIAQNVVEFQRNAAARAAWNPQSGEPKPPLAPKIYHVFDLLPSRQQLAEAKGFWGYWGLIPSTESIEAFDKDLKDSSILSQAFLSPAQQILTGALGTGNEQAYVGQPGWLFYRPDVDYATGPGFLEPSFLKARSHAAKEIQPDPIKSILDFKAQLAARGIDLYVMPVPTKPMVELDHLVGPRGKGLEPENPSYPAFTQELAKNGVTVLDVPDMVLADKRANGVPRYLETDTHWRPETMDNVAKLTADEILGRSKLPTIPDPGYALRPITITNLGDIASMLKLPKGQTIFRPQTVQTGQVVTPDGKPWENDTNADVLLLGDSFSNIYSQEGLNWGSASGLAEHLSYHLKRPVDRIAINAGGSYSSRRELYRQMRRVDRLAGKRVVIYEFSMRDLSQGDWQMITLPKPKAAPPPVNPNPPVKSTAHIELAGIEPASFDPNRGEKTTARFTVTKGAWRAVVYDAAGKALVTLGEGAAELDGEAQAIWDGKGPDGKPAKPGTYRITVTGMGEDGNSVEPVSGNVLIVAGGGGLKPAIGIGAVPPRIDAKKKEATVATFQAPMGDYLADVLGAGGRAVRRLGHQVSTGGTLTVRWDGANESGGPVADGVYQIRISKADGKLPPAEVPVTVASGGGVKPPVNNNGGTKPPPVQAGPLIVTGRIAARADSPQKGAYKDALIAIELTDLRSTGGKPGNDKIVVYVWGMRDNNLVDGAYTVGSTVTLKLTPWEKASGNLTSLNRRDLDDPDSLDWPTFWGEPK